jgi:hypothetical protein
MVVYFTFGMTMRKPRTSLLIRSRQSTNAPTRHLAPALSDDTAGQNKSSEDLLIAGALNLIYERIYFPDISDITASRDGAEGKRLKPTIRFAQ